MPQTRISQDVWQLAEKVAVERGLSNPRAAIEAIVRVYADAYLSGSTLVLQPSRTAVAEPIAAGVSAQEAFAELLAS